MTYRDLTPEEHVEWRKRVTDFAARSTEAVNALDIDPSDVEAKADAIDKLEALIAEGLDTLSAIAAAYQPTPEAQA